MQYKTIVHELLQQRTKLHEQLRQTRQLLPTIEALAAELRNQHLALTESIAEANPKMDPSLIPTQALELVVKELESHLHFRPQAEEDPTRSLDEAMAYIRRHMSHD